MLSKKLEQQLNDQLQFEFESAYLYLSMSTWFDAKNLKGFTNWMRVQHLEEQAHALHMLNYISERGGTVKLQAIQAPKYNWKNSIEVFKDTLAHEQTVTKRINELVSLAASEKDHATFNFLQWYVGEQVEEEANVSQILEQLKLIDGKGSGLFMIDKDMQARVYVDPFPAKA